MSDAIDLEAIEQLALALRKEPETTARYLVWVSALSAATPQLIAQLREAREENERLRKALEPFAKAAELFPPREPDAWDMAIYSPAAGSEYNLSGDHLRAAARALKGASS